MTIPVVTVLVVVSWVPMPIVTVSPLAGCARAKATDAMEIAIESEWTWRTMFIPIRLEALHP